MHRHCRDGLLKGNIEELDEDESVFHCSPHQYYELRPCESLDIDKIEYKEDELKSDYWNNLCLAEFWSRYEIVYKSQRKKKQKPQNKIDSFE